MISLLSSLLLRKLILVLCGQFYKSFSVIVPSPGVSPCETGEVRLVGAVTNATSGRVEVCVSGVWGSVCNSGGWDAVNAAVVCHQLTLPSASVLTQL